MIRKKKDFGIRSLQPLEFDDRISFYSLGIVESSKPELVVITGPVVDHIRETGPDGIGTGDKAVVFPVITDDIQIC